MRKFTLVPLGALAACSSLSSADPERTYTEAVSNLNLLPIYPPRQNFRTGSVYILPKDTDKFIKGVYIGHLAGVESYVIDHARQAIPPYYDTSKIAEARKNMPFADPLSVSSYVYPVVTMSAETANAFGGIVPGGTGLLNLARSKQVIIGFENTVKFGMNDNVPVPRDFYYDELYDILNAPNGVCESAEYEDKIGPLGEKIRLAKTPGIGIVNGIVYSDAITFSYQSKRSFSAAASAGTTTSGQLPSINLNINTPTIETGSDDQNMQGMAPTSLTASTVNAEGNTITITKPTAGYVAIAYSYFEIDQGEFSLYCQPNNR